ncbi:unnamed protein product [Dibothriocephalus latus]|uniref:Uncharacterized protein n=1 Tax=Dibothriocephalus latus TaxID=60516 RepID=A0A3P7PQ83_DIBLA|nr:unnamed protein product [Dibothriocephalus latus]
MQSKLANSREQIRALDATNDNYRKQLDEAKQLLQQKDVQAMWITLRLCYSHSFLDNRTSSVY